MAKNSNIYDPRSIFAGTPDLPAGRRRSAPGFRRRGRRSAGRTARHPAERVAAHALGRQETAFRADLTSMRRMVKNPKVNLHARIPHGTGQTVLREVLVVADHTAYHLGQMVLVRRLLGAWK